MQYGDNDRVCPLNIFERLQVDAIVFLGLHWVSDGIGHPDLHPVIFEFLNDIHHTGIAKIWNILFKGDAKDSHLCI